MIPKQLTAYIANNRLRVLRSKHNNRALNVSFSDEGLMYSMSNQAKFILFKNAWVQLIGDRLVLKGNLALNDKVYIEDFVPRVFDEANLQKAEFTFIDKALKLLNYHELKSQLERVPKEFKEQ